MNNENLIPEKDQQVVESDFGTNEATVGPAQIHPTGNPVIDELQEASLAEAIGHKPIEEDAFAKLESEYAVLKENHMRLFAEFDNYKKRALRERADFIRSAGSDILLNFLPVLDDFERAIKAGGSNQLPDGILLIYQKLKSQLEQKGLKEMKSIGEVFNEDYHEAISKIPVSEQEKKGKVMDEVEKGYWYNDKVIRYAKVVVGD